jgi:hypothetical protein
MDDADEVVEHFALVSDTADALYERMVCLHFAVRARMSELTVEYFFG